jgi:hypothetical protein
MSGSGEIQATGENLEHELTGTVSGGGANVEKFSRSLKIEGNPPHGD